jgi:hypothetical protein
MRSNLGAEIPHSSRRRAGKTRPIPGEYRTETVFRNHALPNANA